jgi:hypothetical protein
LFGNKIPDDPAPINPQRRFRDLWDLYNKYGPRTPEGGNPNPLLVILPKLYEGDYTVGEALGILFSGSPLDTSEEALERARNVYFEPSEKQLEAVSSVLGISSENINDQLQQHNATSDPLRAFAEGNVYAEESAKETLWETQILPALEAGGDFVKTAIFGPAPSGGPKSTTAMFEEWMERSLNDLKGPITLTVDPEEGLLLEIMIPVNFEVNGEPLKIKIFDEDGNFVGVEEIGEAVWNAAEGTWGKIVDGVFTPISEIFTGEEGTVVERIFDAAESIIVQTGLGGVEQGGWLGEVLGEEVRRQLGFNEETNTIEGTEEGTIDDLLNGDPDLSGAEGPVDADNDGIDDNTGLPLVEEEEETEGSDKDGFEGEERPRKTYSEQLKEISNTVIPNKKGETASTGEKTYETAYDAEVKKLEKLLGKNNYKGEVAIALSDAIGTPGSIADKASALNKQLLNIMGAKKKQKGRIAEIAYDAVNKIKQAEIAAGKMTGTEKLQQRTENLLKIIENPKTPNAIKKRAEADLARLEKSISMLGKGDSIQLRRDKTAMLQQLNTALIGIKSKKKGSKERNELIEQLKAQYKINVGGYPEFKEDFDRIITSAGIEGVDVTKFAMGGRVKRADGTPKSDISGAVKMEETVKETVNTGPETPTAPVKKMDYAEIRNRLPKEITDDVVQLISQSQEAMQDFAYIRTQGDVDAFNLKYGVNLVLPANT